MNITVSFNPLGQRAHIIDVQGEIDVYTSPKLKESIAEMIEKNHVNLAIDLSKVRYIDSTGLGVLIGALKRIRENSGRIVLVCNNSQILKIFSITGLSKIFTICDTVKDAEAEFENMD